VAEDEVVPLAARDAFTLPGVLDEHAAVSLRWGSRTSVRKTSISVASRRAAAARTSGGDGGDGGPGGDGGNVVVVACAPGACDLDLLKKIIVSAGGAGARAARAGPAVPAARAARVVSRRPTWTATATPVVDDPGCTGGPPGSSGRSGTDGMPGHAGAPGRVTFQIAP
jgi:hypothetical protein